MVELNTIYNEDCFETIKRMDNGSVDVVLTSPPYNNSRTSHSEYSMNTRNCRYIDFDDNKTNDEYSNWTVELFNGYDQILKPNGVVLYNISYGNENPNVLWETLFAIMHNTNFMCKKPQEGKFPSCGLCFNKNEKTSRYFVRLRGATQI